MVAKIRTFIYVEVADQEQGEAACGELDLGLADQLIHFPEGEVIGVNVDSFEEASQSDLEERGFVE